MRYCGQSDDFACGPIAAGNALKYFELLRSFSRVRADYLKRFKCNKFTSGTSPANFHRGIVGIDENLVVIKRIRPTRKTFDEMLGDGYGAIVRFAWPKWETYHYAFFEPKESKSAWYVTANFWGGSTALKRLGNKDVKENLFGKTHKDLVVWFVRKR